MPVLRAKPSSSCVSGKGWNGSQRKTKWRTILAQSAPGLRFAMCRRAAKQFARRLGDHWLCGGIKAEGVRTAFRVGMRLAKGNGDSTIHQLPSIMKSLLHFFAVSSFTAVLLTGASYLGSPLPGAVTTPSPVIFGSHIRSKVLQYFDTLEDDPAGLSPGFGQVKMTRGKVVTESERESLTDVPKELARVLPDCRQRVGYHLAGSYLIAVDSHYKILDSILIPAVHRTDARDLEIVQWMTHHAGGRR